MIMYCLNLRNNLRRIKFKN